MLNEQQRYEIAIEVLGYTKAQLKDAILSANEALDEVERSCMKGNEDSELKTALEALDITLILSAQPYKDWEKPHNIQTENAKYVCNMLGIDVFENLTGTLQDNKPYDVRDTFTPELS